MKRLKFLHKILHLFQAPARMHKRTGAVAEWLSRKLTVKHVHPKVLLVIKPLWSQQKGTLYSYAQEYFKLQAFYFKVKLI